MSWASLGLPALVLWCTCLCGCRKAPEGVPLTAPFNDQTVVAVATIAWKRGPGEGDWGYEVTVQSRLADRLYVRIAGLRALDAGGRVVGRDETAAAEVLRPHGACGILRGEMRVPDAVEPKGFQIDATTVPLSALGQALYREWRMAQSRVAVDAVVGELKAMVSMVPCSPTT